MAGGGPMHLPVGPDRTTGAPHKGFPHPSGAGDRARLDRFRLRRGLEADDGPAYAAAAWPPSTRPAATATTLDRPGGRWGRSPSRTGARPAPVRGTGPGWPGGWRRWRSTPATPPPAGRRGRGLGEPRRRPDLDAETDGQPTAAVGAVAFASEGPGGRLCRHRPGRGAGRPRGRAAALGRRRRHLAGAGRQGAARRRLPRPAGRPEDPGRVLAATTAGLWASPTAG